MTNVDTQWIVRPLNLSVFYKVKGLDTHLDNTHEEDGTPSRSKGTAAKLLIYQND